MLNSQGYSFEFTVVAIVEWRDGFSNDDGIRVSSIGVNDVRGGVALYIREYPSIIFKERAELTNKDIECLVGEVFLPKTKPFLIGTFYRPPKLTVLWIHKFETMTDLITFEDK